MFHSLRPGRSWPSLRAFLNSDLLAHPADVPLAEAGKVVALLARFLELRGLGDFLWRFLRDVLLDIGAVRVIVVADRAHREAARAAAERADHAQQALPETEEIP